MYPSTHPTGTQNLLRENLSLKKYSNVITYENAQLKETLRRQKGYWADTDAAITEEPPELPTSAVVKGRSVNEKQTEMRRS